MIVVEVHIAPILRCRACRVADEQPVGEGPVHPEVFVLEVT